MIAKLLDWLDERLGTASFVSGALRKAFPDHWSFMLGEINMYAFLVLLVTGTYLALFFRPDAAETTYAGPYTILAGRQMSEAYASALKLSFEVNGGLLIRQIHHWSALVFVAGIVAHMARVFFTGAFRKPRELNWVIGIALFLLAIFEGFSGYSLPDDMLSGTGLRIADSVLLSVPIVGTWLSFLLLGGAYPTHALIPRLFVVHIYLVPIAIAGLIGLHLAIVWRQKHTQFPGPGRTDQNVVGSPLFPKYAMKSAALLAAVVAVLAALGTLVQINPIWLYGPYRPWIVSSPAQPDWYVGWLEGLLRIGPAVALHVFGHTVPSPFWSAVLVPSLVFAFLVAYPWIEAALTGDRAAHNLLDRPREVPLRTALGAALAAFAVIATLAGSSDVQARYVHWPIVALTHAYQVLIFVGPCVAFALTYAIARELRAANGLRVSQRVRVRRGASGGFDHEDLS